MKKVYFLFQIIVFLLCTNSKLIAQQQNAYILRNVVWHRTQSTGNSIQISVCWDNPTSENQRYRELVREAITETWQKYSAVQFTDWCPATQKDGDIHIYINDEGPHTIGLGTQLQHRLHGMILNFTFENWSQACRTDKDYCIKAIAVHEFGHALGFAHEQNRPDCSFPNCLGQEQGGNGDWTITPCDLNSVMNYCNPHYNNDGFLSALDIRAIQYLYGLPENLSNEYKGLQLVYNSSLIKVTPTGSREISHEFKIYISGNQQDLGKIDHVLYYLDPNWFTGRQREIIASNRSSNFGIGLKVWRPVNIVAFIFIKDEGDQFFQEKVISQELKFEESGQTNIVGNNL